MTQIKTYLNILLLSIVSLGITNCGGGGAASHKLIIETDAVAVAYKSADTQWSTQIDDVTDQSSGFKRYAIDMDGDYQVALYCDLAKSTVMLAMTTQESPVIHYKCPRKYIIQTTAFTGNLSDQTDVPDGYIVSMGTDYTIIAGATGNYSLHANMTKPNDLIAITAKTPSGNITPQRFYIERDILTDDKTSQDISFKTTNSSNIEGKNFTLQNATQGSILLITQNGTYFTSERDGKWYYPTQSLIDSDIFLMTSSIPANRTYGLKSVTATNIAKNDISLDASYIKSLTQVGYLNDGLNGLSQYQADTRSPLLRGYLALLKNNTHQKLYLAISTGFLEKNDPDIFIPDDLSALEGFGNSWHGDNASNVNVSAVMSDVVIGDILYTDRTLNLTLTDFPLVKDATIEVADQMVK
jgi:hypothetical protein